MSEAHFHLLTYILNFNLIQNISGSSVSLEETGFLVSNISHLFWSEIVEVLTFLGLFILLGLPVVFLFPLVEDSLGFCRLL